MFAIFPGSALAKLKTPPPWILCFTIMETSRVFGRCCAAVEGAWLEEIAPELCSRTYDRIAWAETSGFVFARQRLFAGALPIHPGRRCHYGRVNQEEARAVFIREALTPCRVREQAAPWLTRCTELVRRLESLEAKLRRNGGKSALADAAELYELGRTLNAAAKLASHLEVEARLEAGQGDDIENYIK
jgi:ATP-dependent helicase HrpA